MNKNKPMERTLAVNPEKRIKVSSITFNAPPFRKLRNARIGISDRITLIAGHNGIGKSTILGLLSSTFGLTDQARKSYFQEPFYTNIERVIYIALDEVDTSQKDPSAAPIVEAELENRIIRKRCSLTRRTEWKRARVVPRTVDPEENDWIGPDAKIPLPTIYLGMRRLASAGEADEKEVSSASIDDMDEADRELMAEFFNSVITGSDVTSEITRHSIRGIKKRSAHPGHKNHSTLAISMGQDSLGSIATALASFNHLKREMGDSYPGGLLIIDEIDVGFHPHAIDRLVRALKTQANQLQLQIVATTHSPRMISAIHPEGSGNDRDPDSIIYIVDTKQPRLAEDQSLNAILSDMALDIDAEKNACEPEVENLCVYFEDAEAMQFFEAFVPVGKRRALGRKIGRSIKLIPLGISGATLINLPNNDPIFSERLLVVDSDTTVSNKARSRGNVVKLPCAPKASGTGRSPENLIKDFLRSLRDAADGPFYESLLKLKTANPSSDKIQNTFFSDGDGDSYGRESSKKWWTKHWTILSKWGVLELWRDMHKKQVDTFIKELEAAAALTAERLKPSLAKLSKTC